MVMRDRFPAAEYPFSDKLCQFMDDHPEFYRSLKLSNPRRFEFLPFMLLSSTPPDHPLYRDQVIGFLYLDKKRNNGVLFKQDYIVNKNRADLEYISYSTTNDSGIYVRPIREFFELYGNNQIYYHNGQSWHHRYQDVEQLPEDERLRNVATEIKNRFGIT